MAPKTFSGNALASDKYKTIKIAIMHAAPKAWKRPGTRIYADNYRFGNSLYSGAVADLDKRSVDRPVSVMPFRSFSPPIETDRGVRRAVLEADLGIANYSNSELHRSLSAQRMNELGLTANYKHISQQEQTTTTTTSSALATAQAGGPVSPRAPLETFSTYASAKALANVEAELEESRARRRRQRAALFRPESYYEDASVALEPELTSNLEQSRPSPFWMERWYTKSMRAASRNYYPI